MRYFDFHAHIIFKQLFDDNPNIDATFGAGDITTLPRECTDLPNIVSSQINQSKLAEINDKVIVGVVLYAPESHLAKEVMPLRQYLRGSSKHKLSAALMNGLALNAVKAFSDFVLDRTLSRYLAASESFHLITPQNLQSLPANKINIFFVVEGCHSLVDSTNEYTGSSKFSPQEILANTDILLQQVKIVSINLTHLQQSNLCNHAFAMQLARPDPFFPRGNGLQPDGRAVIQGFFDRGICIDLKHMSYRSRLQLREEMDAGNFSNSQPPVCSHAAFTGIPFSDWQGYIAFKKPAGGVIYAELAKTMHTRNGPPRPGAPAFNLSTINLFDEEITWIVRNGGVIGLSMDRRILGYVDRYDENPTGLRVGSELVVDKEFYSPEEWRALGIKDNQLGKKIIDGDCVTLTDLEESTQSSIPRRNEYFYDHVLLQLKHYLQVCHDAGIAINTAAKHITIGSDFDGLINPFIQAADVTDMRGLKDYILMNFRYYLETLIDARQWVDQLDISGFVEDLFYNNGWNFLQQRMNS